MARQVILNSPHKNFEQIKKIDEDGVEYWEARELMLLINYSNWQNFEKIINKAKKACEKSEQSVKYHFIDVSKMV